MKNVELVYSPDEGGSTQGMSGGSAALRRTAELGLPVAGEIHQDPTGDPLYRRIGSTGLGNFGGGFPELHPGSLSTAHATIRHRPEY